MRERLELPMSIATTVSTGVTGAVSRALATWGALAPRTRMAALGGAGILAIGLAAWLFAGGRSCGERADVEARVADISSAMQADAASGKITVEELAARVKKVNAAATAFETSNDLGGYCEALETLNEQFAPR